MSQRNFIISIFITAILCRSEAELSQFLKCVFSNTPQVEDPGAKFIQTFNIALASNENLLKQFNVSLPPKECYKAIHDFGVVFYSLTQATDPYQIADDLGKITQYKFQGLPPKDLADVFIKSLEQVLKEQDALTKENAAQLALNFVQDCNFARNSPAYDGSPQSNIATLYSSALNFVQDLIPNNGDIIGEIFEHNLNLLPDRVPHAPEPEDIVIKNKIEEVFKS